jgi:hypothetical protein
LIQEAENALAYGQRMVKQWLVRGMFSSNKKHAARLASKAAKYFNDASKHKSHGRRIDREEARSQSLTIEDLEASQLLQEHVLTSYHLMTLAFEKSSCTKMITNHLGRAWVKNLPEAPPPRPGAPHNP